MDHEYYHSQAGSDSGDGLEDLPLAAQAAINLSLFLLLAPIGMFFMIASYKIFMARFN